MYVMQPACALTQTSGNASFRTSWILVKNVGCCILLRFSTEKHLDQRAKCVLLFCSTHCCSKHLALRSEICLLRLLTTIFLRPLKIRRLNIKAAFKDILVCLWTVGCRLRWVGVTDTVVLGGLQ